MDIVFFKSIPEYLPILLLLMLISSSVRFLHYKYFERYFKLTFESAPVWSLFYFSFWFLVLVFLFPQEIYSLFSQINFLGYLALTAILLVVFPAFFRYMRLSVGNPKWLAEKFPGQGILSLEERYILAKIGDVLFQQGLAGIMLLVLLAHGFEYSETVIIFIALFSLAHIYIFRTAGFVWGIHYTVYAALAGFAFPFLIIFIKGGIGYSIVLHMMFYVFSAAFFAKLPYPSERIKRHIGTVAH